MLALVAGWLFAWPHPAHAADPIVCTDWTQVNNGAFGMGTGGDSSYSSEEGFEVIVFEDRLYVGMEADNVYGARLWRTKPAGVAPGSQADWEEVIADANGKPFGVTNVTQNDHVDSLAAFDGHLYVSTANRGSSTYGTQVWRSPAGDAGTWTQVNADGFGDIRNTNFKDMQVFDGWLCGGTQNWVTGAQVWCTADGTSWVQKNHGGFGASGDDEANVEAWSGYVYGGALYFGVQDTGAIRLNPDGTAHSGDDVAHLYRTTDLGGTPTWTEVYSGPAGSRRADILGDLNGYLYIATSGAAGIIILRSSSGDAGAWTQVNTAGMEGDSWNTGAVVDGAAVHNGALYVAVSNVGPEPAYLTHGLELWRTAGVEQNDGPLVDWQQVGGSGLGDGDNRYAELIPFNGALYAWTSSYANGQQVRRADCPVARNIILMIGDGMGANHLAAANAYTGASPAYQSWTRSWATTYAASGSYDPTQAWTVFDYVKSDATDSAAAATALYSGVKTSDSRISISADGTSRLFTISDKARTLGKAVGAVTTVQISHATPAAWIAHNASRANGYAIADEGLWGNPNTTGFAPADGYTGGYGNTPPPVDVLIGGGHPTWNNSLVNAAQRDKLAAESGADGAFTFVERLPGHANGGARLLAAADTSGLTRLAGLFGGTDGNIEYRLADGSGHNPENPTLAEMAQAALTVLNRDPSGFVLMIEGGAVDWGAHANIMDQVLGEVAGFNAAVQTVVNWVDANDPAWSNTLVIVTADHETGYLTARPGVYPNTALGTIDNGTLLKEKLVYQGVISTGLRASWDDVDDDKEIDSGETVYWAWNSGSHTNSLVPVYARGAGAGFLAGYATGSDTVRGAYLDNTDIFRLMDAVTLNDPSPVPAAPPLAPSATIARVEASDDVRLTWAQTPGATAYEAWESASPYFNPGDPGASKTDVAAADAFYDDSGALSTPGATFYSVRGAGEGGKSAISARLGAFVFALEPGQ